MRAIDAMFVWTPDREPFDPKLFPLRGKVAATTVAESVENRQHPLSAGACDYGWRQTSDAGRRELAQQLVSQMIHYDNIPIAEVRNAFAQVDELAGFPFHTDPPPEEEEIED